MKNELFLKIKSDELGSEEIWQDTEYVMHRICLWVYENYQTDHSAVVPNVHIVDLNYPVIGKIPTTFRVKAYWLHTYFHRLVNAITEHKELLDTVKQRKYYGELVKKCQMKVPHNIDAHDFNEKTMTLDCIVPYDDDGVQYYGLDLRGDA